MSRICIRTFKLLHRFGHHARIRSTIMATIHSGGQTQQDKDVEKLYMDPKVQSILKNITQQNLESIFKQKQVKNLFPSKHMFMTDEDYKEAMDRSKKIAKKNLRMPPVMNPRKEHHQILSKDPEIQGYFYKYRRLIEANNPNIVFTDISKGFSDRTRLIAVREANGILRRANLEERQRMNQIYFPLPERTLEMPKMFEEEHLEETLKNQDYLFVLERACIQFEPDDPNYIRVTQRTYDVINDNNHFGVLQSTRHFGPMSFYYALAKKIDNLLLDMIQRELISNGAQLVELYYIVNPKSGLNIEKLHNPLNIIQHYVKEDCTNRPQIELALQAYEELMKQRETLDHEVHEIHGQKLVNSN